MSYHVRLEIFWSGEEADQVLSAVEEYLLEDGTIGLLDDLSEAFDDQPVEIKGLNEEWVKGLFTCLSGRFPEESFGVRGVGEEIEDVWVLWFRAGRILWGASLDGEREGPLQEETPASAWPEPLDIDRVVREAGLKKFFREILLEQPPSATLGALTLKSWSDERPRALVHVGPLEHGVNQRISDLFESRYKVQLFRNAEMLLKYPTATAKNPCGY